METVYIKRYTADPIPYALPPISIPAGDLMMTAVPFPHKGILERLCVEQASGTPVAFTARLFNSQQVLAPGNYPVAQALNNPDLYDVFDIILTATAGNPAKVGAEHDFGYGFLNADGTNSNPQRFLYLLITPTLASGVTTWNVMLQARLDMG